MLVYVKSGNRVKAKHIVEWSKTNATGMIRDKCRLNYAKGFFTNIKKSANLKNRISTNSLTANITTELVNILTIIKPIVDRVIAEQKIYNEIESQIILLAIEIYFTLNKIQEIKNLASLLFTWNSIPLGIGSLALQGIITIKSNIPERLRNEHPDSHKAAILAAILEGEVFKEHETAYHNLKTLLINIQDDTIKYECCSALYQIAQYINIEYLKEVKNIAFSYLGTEHRFTLLIQAGIFIRTGQDDQAKDILLNIKDENNPLWLQLYSQYLVKNGKKQEALEYMDKVCTLLPHPGIMYSTVKLAYKARNFDIAIDLLKKMLESDPRNIDILEKLAIIFYTKGDFSSALIYFKQLNEHEPSEVVFLMNLGTCYVQTGDLHNALTVFDKVCAFENPPLTAFLSRAYVHANQDPVKAFESLLQVKEEYWEDPQYLQVFRDLFSEKNAEVFTGWILSEFLPSFPQNIKIRPPQQGKFFVDSLIGYYLTFIMTIKNEQRAKKALQFFIHYLAISKEEYLKQVMNLLDYFEGPNAEKNKEYKKAILSFLLKHIQDQDIDARSIVFLHKHGIFNQEEHEGKLPDIRPVLKNPNHPLRMKTIPGPHILYYKDENHIHIQNSIH